MHNIVGLNNKKNNGCDFEFKNSILRKPQAK